MRILWDEATSGVEALDPLWQALRGYFPRVARPDTEVELTAPLVYGYWEFEKWIRNGSSQPAGDPVLTVQLNSDTKAEAKYTYEGPVVSVADFNGDLSVDMRDFSILAGAWLTVPQHDTWEGACDISTPADYYIDGYDVEVLCSEWLTVP